MSVSSELIRLAGNIGTMQADVNATMDAIEAKGVTVPAGAQLHDVPGLIEQIETYEPVVSPIKFYTIGSQEEDGKDKPLYGGLSSRAFDSSTFYKTTENGKTLFNVVGSDNWYYVYWNDILDTWPTDGSKFYIELLYKNTKVTTSSYRTSLISFFGRLFEVGMENGTTTLSLGATGSGVLPTVVYKDGSYSKISGLGDYDYKVKNDALVKDQVYKVSAIISYVSSGYANVDYSIDDKMVLSLSIKRANVSNKNQVCCTLTSPRLLTFGHMKIIDLNVV